jgi:hypothetical protein
MCLMNTDAILADIGTRNALRRAHGLPLLDVPAEYAHQVLVAQQRDYRVACDEHAAERDAIRRQVLTEYRAKYGPNFGGSMGGRWAIGHVTLMRFTEHMVERYGIAPPGQAG